jgi:hypothetical protein
MLPAVKRIGRRPYFTAFSKRGRTHHVVLVWAYDGTRNPVVNQQMPPMHTSPQRLAAYPRPLSFAQGNDPEGGSPHSRPASRLTAPHGELPYRVELWDEAGKSVEQVLAVTAHSSIGYAAYYAATREYPDRYVTLRHKDRIVSRSNTPEPEH